jgi:CRP/FNR family transcriptional regulator, anaerobic regulatory protein
MPGSSPSLLPHARCADCPVRKSGACCALADEHVSELADIMVHRQYAAGSEIVHQEDCSELFAIVLNGTVKLSRVLEDGRQQIVGLLSASDSLGDLYADKSHDTAECVTDVTLCSFPRQRFNAVLDRHPELQRQLLLRAMEDLDDARQWILALGQKSAEEKVASFLLWLWDKHRYHAATEQDPDNALIMNSPFTRRETAEFLGLTLETVSRQFTRLRAKGVIGLLSHKRIEIKKLDALRRLAEQER